MHPFLCLDDLLDLLLGLLDLLLGLLGQVLEGLVVEGDAGDLDDTDEAEEEVDGGETGFVNVLVCNSSPSPPPARPPSLLLDILCCLGSWVFCVCVCVSVSYR